MPVPMKALRSFGVAGASEGKVRRGREFMAATPQRAKELEEHGLAYAIAVPDKKMEPLALNTMEPPPENKAAHAGPLPLAGGETGADSAPSSSDQDRPLRGRRSRKREVEPGS